MSRKVFVSEMQRLFRNKTITKPITVADITEATKIHGKRIASFMNLKAQVEPSAFEIKILENYFDLKEGDLYKILAQIELPLEAPTSQNLKEKENLND